jgi:hypothetical protein
VFTPAWLDPADVTQWLDAHGEPTDGELARVCSAAEIKVQRCRPDQYVTDQAGQTPPVYVPDAEVYQGAVMWAAREMRRRNSPGGVESFGDIGPSFVARYDPDIEAALWIGAHTRPGVG